LGVEILFLILRSQSKSSFQLANVAKRLSVLVLPTLETELEVKTEDVFLIRVKVHFVCDVIGAEKIFGTARSAFKAVRTLPTAFWHFN